MVLPNELFQIPASFDNLAVRWIDSDEAKGIGSIERQSMKGGVRDIRRYGRAHGIDDFAPVDGFAANPRRDGIPVDERKRRAVVVHGDPRSTAGFRRTHYAATVHILLFRGETGRARLVADLLQRLDGASLQQAVDSSTLMAAASFPAR